MIVDSLFGVPLAFVGGLVGGSGLAGAYFAHLLRRREASQSARLARVVERKADVYRRCAAFLRSARGIPMVAAVDHINDLSDEMLLWASADVYREFSRLTRRMISNLRGDGSDWPEMILPTLKAMTKDINPELVLASGEDVIPHVTFVDHGSVDALWRAARNHPAEFNKIALLLKQNGELMRDIVRHRYGDYDATSQAILDYVRSTSPNSPPSSDTGLPAAYDEAVAMAVLGSFVSHPSKDAMLTIGQITEFVGAPREVVQEYLALFLKNKLVEEGQTPAGGKRFTLTSQGEAIVTSE